MPTSRSGTFMCSTSTATGATWTELPCRNSGKALISECFFSSSGFQLGVGGGGGGEEGGVVPAGCVHTPVCMHTGTHVYMCPYTQACMCFCIHAHTHTNMCTHTQKRMCTRTHRHTRARTHKHAHTCAPPPPLFFSMDVPSSFIYLKPFHISGIRLILQLSC